ncbi:MAG: hypothetical protein V1746_06315 [bacterium]
MLKSIIVLSIGAGLLLSATPLFAQRVEVQLYHAQNSDVRDDLKPKHELRKSLDLLIGYRYYERLGSASCDLEKKARQRLQPHPMFALQLDRCGSASNCVKLELFQESKSIFKGEFFPKPKTPLIITGPMYANGRLVLVLISRR